MPAAWVSRQDRSASSLIEDRARRLSAASRFVVAASCRVRLATKRTETRGAGYSARPAASMTRLRAPRASSMSARAAAGFRGACRARARQVPLHRWFGEPCLRRI